jgi:hypothetical protein
MNVISVQANASGTCTVTITLDNGDTLGTIVSFQSIGGCCSDVFAAIDSSAFEYRDAGSATQ